MNIIKHLIKQILPKCVREYIYIYIRRGHKIDNIFKTDFSKNCLLAYIINPFVNGVSYTHQNSWQVIEIAKAISEFGYNVDVCDYNYNKSDFNKKYDLLIDLHPRDNAVYNKFSKPECIKIAYLTGSNTSFSNISEQKRVDDVYRRRNVKLIPRRQAPLISKRIESYDAAFFIGNEYNLRTYSEFKIPPVYFIKNTGYKFNFSTENRNPKNFMFLASAGQVHKGLDLLLEVFADRCKDLNLYICSGFENETDFCNAYKEELYHTSNIHPIGFINIKSEKFREIAEKCAYMIMPSCSEANAGSVLTAMSAGMIPIVSRECGFDDDEVIHLKDCSLKCIEETVKFYAMKDANWIKVMSEKSVNIVNERYSEKCFTQSIIQALSSTLNKGRGKFE